MGPTPPTDLVKTLRAAMAPYWKAFMDLQRTVDRVRDVVFSRPMSITEEIDRIPGRRIFFTYIQVQFFDMTNNHADGQVITWKTSQDGPFIQTHYPLIMWRPTLPTTTTNLGIWRPVSSWPLPTQQIGTDIIDISYQLSDQGSGRFFQDGAVPAGLLSRPDAILPLPVPTLFKPDTTIGMVITYNNILFNGAEVPPTQGVAVVALPGYKIVNM